MEVGGRGTRGAQHCGSEDNNDARSIDENKKEIAPLFFLLTSVSFF